MGRIGSLGGPALALFALACAMPNPAFEELETEDVAEGADAGESADSKSSEGDPSTSGDSSTSTSTTTSGDGDGDPPTTSGDGDGDPPTTSGDGDGDPPTTSGDGDGDPNSTGDGDGDPITTGDGDGDAIALCPLLVGDDCQQCAAMKCCEDGVEICFEEGSSCKCVLDCRLAGFTNTQCAVECQAGVEDQALAEGLLACVGDACVEFCPNLP